MIRFAVHLLNLLLIFFIDDPALDFHGRRQFAGGNIKGAAENRKIFYLLVTRQSGIDMIDFLRDKRLDIRMIGQVLL